MAENLHIVNRSGFISLDDVVISGEMGLETRNGNISLYNVIADENQLIVSTRSGRIFVSY